MISDDDQAVVDKNTVHIWNISMDETFLDLPELLSDDELSRYRKIKHQKARTGFLRTRVALRLILARYLLCSGADIVFNYTENGKPELSQDTPGSLQFNLSHSGNYCLLAVTTGRDVGIDIERLQHDRDYAALAQRFFTAAEHKMCDERPDNRLFYRMWVLKEASVKARGMKLLQGLDRFECMISKNKSLNVVDKLEKNDQDNWSLRQWQPDEYSIAAIAVRCKKARFIEKTLTNMT